MIVVDFQNFTYSGTEYLVEVYNWNPEENAINI